MKILRVEIDGFGPYKERQTISFPSKGVVAVHGDNGRGKTSLLNAMRYVFTGDVRDRSGRPIDLHALVNDHNKAEGRFGFSCKVALESSGKTYEITRALHPLPGISPKHSGDYEESLFVSIDGDQLSEAEAAEQVRQILPSEISRFFFFDGELLAEYEALVTGEESSGRRIKQSIESILGLPILQTLRQNLRVLAEKRETSYTQLARKAGGNRGAGEMLGETRETIVKLEQAIATRRDRHVQVLREIEGVHTNMSRLGQKGILVGQLQTKQKELADIRIELGRQEAHCKTIMGDAWRVIVAPPVNAEIAQLTAQVGNEEIGDHAIALAQAMTKGGKASRDCPICGMALNSASEQHMRSLLQKPKEELAKRARLAVLRDIRLPTASAPYEKAIEDLVRLRTKDAGVREEIRELEQDLAGFDVEGYETVRNRLATLYSERDALVAALEKDTKQLEQAKKTMDGLRKAVDQQASTDQTLAEARKAYEKYDQIYRLADAAVGKYRDQLAKDVQASATKVFLRISNEPDFASLKINPEYGLEIVHKDGRVVQIRSAGFEQVVALSLIAALHSNAPFRGPLVMDSFFGRLDEHHTSKLVESLGSLTDQSILLVHSNEMSADDVRRLVGPALQDQLAIDRVRHGECRIISKRGGP